MQGPMNRAFIRYFQNPFPLLGAQIPSQVNLSGDHVDFAGFCLAIFGPVRLENPSPSAVLAVIGREFEFNLPFFKPDSGLLVSF